MPETDSEYAECLLVFSNCLASETYLMKPRVIARITVCFDIRHYSLFVYLFAMYNTAINA